MKTLKYIRKPFVVEAVQLTEENFDEVLAWCDGSRDVDRQNQVHIRVRVRHPLNARQTRAYVGDWVLRAGEGFKIYNAPAFEKSFQEVPSGTPATNAPDGMPDDGEFLVHKDQGELEIEVTPAS